MPLIIVFPKGKLRQRPIAVPITDKARYFTIYSPLIAPFFMPIAFMTPISRYSSATVKLMINLSITIEISIRQTLTTNSKAAMRRSIIYIIFIMGLSTAIIVLRPSLLNFCK